MDYDLHRAKHMIGALEIGSDTKASMLKSFARRVELSGSDIFFLESLLPRYP
ncbi:hypothetical protein [Candidatus Methanoperedens nitratireducens]|uniref:Uncharacterized protein n=1 Tax=Candidatus Methanoperedens nitratireducens TaxID=1392998 RepID=A0A284VUD6_9EURY|nr:hypothetical protein [Candidatus Methanoperedens nitroreducens]SNQ62905.1 hypothetical protein MNV_980007 [Candidatus Methanoperedens nitroreducens]